MSKILSILYDTILELPPTKEMMETSARGEAFRRRLYEKFAPEEADDIWNAAMDVGAADSEASFFRGFAMGFQVCQELSALSLTR